MNLAALLARRAALCSVILRHDLADRRDRGDRWAVALDRVTRAIERAYLAGWGAQ